MHREFLNKESPKGWDRSFPNLSFVSPEMLQSIFDRGSVVQERMHTLICGSIAYDTIMVFPGRFKEHILPEKLHILNVAFLVPDMRREFGGCAGNIAYNLDMLGGKPLIMAAVGDDYASYGLDQNAVFIGKLFHRPHKDGA